MIVMIKIVVGISEYWHDRIDLGNGTTVYKFKFKGGICYSLNIWADNSYTFDYPRPSDAEQKNALKKYYETEIKLRSKNAQ